MNKQESGITVPTEKKYSVREIASYEGDERFYQLTFLAQTYLETMLNFSDINSIIYMLDGLKLDVDFIIYIMEQCISEGHKSFSYIKKIAISYAEREIYTIEEARLNEKIRKDIYRNIYKIFGLTYKAPVKNEVSFISKWRDKYGFSDDIILESCRRTMEHTHCASFCYTDRILINWFNNNVKCLEDIEKLDRLHSKEVAKKFRKAAKTKKAPSFDQRSYDFAEQERIIFEDQNRRWEKILSEMSEDERKKHEDCMKKIGCKVKK